MKTKFFTVLLFLAASFTASASDNPVNPNVRATELIERVHEIRKTDRKDFTEEDKIAMKEELKEIKRELRQINKAEGLDKKVSFSIGAIIIAVLVLIIIT